MDQEPPVYEHSDRMTDLDIEEAKMKAAEKRELDRQLALHLDPRDAAYSQEPEPAPNVPLVRGTRSARGEAFWAARAARDEHTPSEFQLDPQPYKHHAYPDRSANYLFDFDFAPREGYDQDPGHYPPPRRLRG